MIEELSTSSAAEEKKAPMQLFLQLSSNSYCSHGGSYAVLDTMQPALRTYRVSYSNPMTIALNPFVRKLRLTQVKHWECQLFNSVSLRC